MVGGDFSGVLPWDSLMWESFFELVGVADVLDIVRAFHHIVDGEERQKSAWAFSFTKTV
ncbi:hypothetical protein HMPREF3038_01165 [Akkermansia sp. KLE1797]|nr:hypothetical protein HMPREF3038_01165 [Akkermansia sp. KLE1797]KXU53317.1 hypothetical protein HMPREF3039_02499 [Akkermansia sp. KLE1798]KZA05147.1 hypothetical protein HMPREF1326_01183 [Akkermansia sp. KLE1605]